MSSKRFFSSINITSGNTLNVSDALTAGNLAVNTAITTSNIATGALTAGNLTVPGALTAGNLTVPGALTAGNLRVSSGIQFPATMVPSSNPNNLDDYEEGTFVPSVFGGGTAGTWSPDANSSGGYYIKIGRLVYVFINTRGTLSGAAGQFRIGNLPFPRAAGDTNASNGYNATYSSFSAGLLAGLTWTANHFFSGWLISPAGYIYGHTTPVGGGAYGELNVSNNLLNIHLAGAYYTD